MARKGHGRPANLVQIAGSGTTYPDDGSSPVGSNEWNANRDTTGILGFTKATSSISSNVVNVTDSYIEITGGGDIYTLASVTTALSTDYYPSDTSTKSYVEGDLLYLVKASGAGTTRLANQNGGAGAGKITTLTGTWKELSATVPTILVARTIGANVEWVEYGGGAVADSSITFAKIQDIASMKLIGRTAGSSGVSSEIALLDEDNLATDSATSLATQQSIKAYVDSQTHEAGDITSVVAGSGLTGGATSGAATVNVIGGTGITANADDIAIDNTVTTLTGTQTLTNKTLTAPVLTTPALGTPSALVGTSITGTAAGLTAGTATVATTVTITDNESTDESNALIFTAGGDIDGGNIGLESDGTCTYNPSTGKITATGFIGALTGNATTVTTNANLAGDVTSSGNTTTIAVDAVDIAMLSATGTASSSTFLRGDNAWTAVSSYATPTIGSTPVPSGTTQAVIAGLTLTSPVLNTGVSGSALLDSDSMSGTSATTVSSSESIKAYVDSSVAANITLKGTYNASTDDPSLDSSPISGIVAGDHYIVSVAGTFFSEVLQVGDSVIAKQDSPTTFAHWITVNSNIVTPIVRANIAGDAIDGTLIEDDAVAAEHLASDAVVNLSVASGAQIATSKLSGALTSVASHGLATSATTDTTNASNIGTGTLAAARVATLNQSTTGTAALATTVTCADNAANETVYPTFVDGATGAQDLETDTGLNYNPSTGTLTSPIFVGALTGNAATASTVTNDAISLAKMAGGTAGNLITYDASGDPAAVVTGNSGQVLTSAGSGQPPTFATASGSFVATATDDLDFQGLYDIETLQRCLFEIQLNNFDDSTRTADDAINDDISGEVQVYVKVIDVNNDGVFARLKKNGSIVNVQLA